MKLFGNKRYIISIILITILLSTIVGIVYGIYSNNKQQTIAQPISEEQEDKNIVENNNTVDTTR